MNLQDFEHYLGDLDLEYGGWFADLSEWEWDYVPILRVTDLDSAVGFDGAVMVERLTVIVPRNKEELSSVLSLVGQESKTDSLWQAIESDSVSDNDKMLITDACLSYGLYDPDQQGYHVNPMYPQSSHKWSAQNMIIIQCEPIHWIDAITDAIKDAKSDLSNLESSLIDAIDKGDSDIEYLESVDNMIEDACLGIADGIRNHLEWTAQRSPMQFDGWKADVRLTEDQDLFSYLLDNGYLSDFE